MRRNRHDERNRGRGERQQFRGEERYREEYVEDSDRWGEGGSGYGREGIGRPVSGYGSQGGGFGMGGSPGNERGRGIGAVGEMGLRAADRTTGHGYGPGGGAYGAPHSRDWAPYREEPDWPRRQHVGEQSFRGRGPRGYKRSDERIREDVCDRLTEDHDLDASDIDVKVEACEVTLEGTVDHRRYKWLAEEIAARCSGVMEVHNHLRVKRHEVERESESSAMPRNGGGRQTQTAQTGLGAQNRTDR